MLVEVTYFLRDCRDFFMQTDEVQSVNSEDFPRSVGEASGKENKDVSVNSEAFACSVDEASEKDDDEVQAIGEAFACSVDEASGQDKHAEVPLNCESVACTAKNASHKDKGEVLVNGEAFAYSVDEVCKGDDRDMLVNSEAFPCSVDEASGKEKKDVLVNRREAFACSVDEASGQNKDKVQTNGDAFAWSLDEASGQDEHEVSVNCKSVACTSKNASHKAICKNEGNPLNYATDLAFGGLNIPLGMLYGHFAEEEPVELSGDVEYVSDSSEENYKKTHSPAVPRKRPLDGGSDEESEDLHVIMKRNSRRKTRAVIVETDSEEERDDSASVGTNCDCHRREKIQSTELEFDMTGGEAVARKRPRDGRSDEENEDPNRVNMKKNSWKRTKAVILDKESSRDQDADVIGKLEVKKKGDEEVVISCSKKGENNARIYDKRHSCFYCDKLYAKIARHYEHHHKDEAEVAEAFAYPRGSKDRKKALEKLRLQGNFHYNLRVLECKKGQLIVMRRPGEDEDCSQDDYLPCIHCLGFVKRKDLWRHNKACNFKSGDKDDKKDEEENDYMKCQKLQAKSKLLILPSLCPGKSSPFQEVVASMKSDQITLVARNDSIISALGAMMVEKVGTRRSHDISQNMRNLARLLMSMREAENNENAQLLQFLCPEKFDVVVQCVMDISNFEVKMGESQVGTPSLALHIGYALKKCVGIVRGKALREKDRGLLEDIEHFEKLMEAEWNYRISHHSMTTLNDRKHNQPDLLPVTSDLQKLKEYITLKIVYLTSKLKSAKPDVRTWRELSELVLNRLILFNKRRGGEAARLRVETYVNRPDWHKSTSQDVLASLSGIEQQLFKRLDLVEIKGKRGRKVPILLTKEVNRAIDVLLQTRSEVGINPENPYLFAVTGNQSLGHLRPWECLRKVAMCEGLHLEKPEAVTSTKLRKYVATVSQILDLQENELDWLARHLGHDISVHREYYRLHDSTIELAKVGKLLCTVDEGKASQWAGRSLDEIDLNIDPVADDRESQSEEDSESDTDAELPSPSVRVQQRRVEGTSTSKGSPSGLNAKTKKTTEDGQAATKENSAKTKKTTEDRQAATKENSAKTKKTTEDRQAATKENSANTKKTTEDRQAATKENSGPTASLAKKKGYNAWTKEEKDAVFENLGDFVKNKKLPGKRDCENCIRQSGGVLINRDWTAVKNCVKNIISRAKALQEKNT